ncbi:MAG: GAF domain-containing protein [Coxiellaceae bacterium]|jgi:response regulator RpfG family c-di-GMP phosphodiesterase|nr:GAF domain-containing protein [Coxiellaceae bacterium]
MITNSTKLEQVLKVTHELLQIQDIDVLLECMLTEVRAIVGADAGSIYLVEGNELEFSYTQNSTLSNKLPYGKKLVYSTFKIKINNQSIAGYVANTGITTNIDDAYRIDSYQPYSFDKHFDETTGYRTQSILTVPIKSSDGKVSGVIQLINAFNPDKTIRSFTSSEESIVQLFADNASIAISNAQMTRSLIMRMNKMIELHDPKETVEHANRIAAYSVEIYEAWARKRGVPEREIQNSRSVLRMAAMFYNIGKISVPNSVLIKRKEDLTATEMITVELHTVYGARLFSNPYSDFEKMVQSITLNHHERWDGSGFPGHIDLDTGLPLPGYEKPGGGAFGKRGPEIPIYGRIVAVADFYDYLIYRVTPDKATKDKAVETILANSGTQFDPDVVAAFISCVDVINSISDRYEDTTQ